MIIPASIELERIDPNPWQPRQGEDPEHIRQVAESIVAQGLMQYPVGRAVPVDPQGRKPPRIQLAFGHTRLAAHRLIAETGLGKLDESERAYYRKMHVVVRPLTDNDMFEMGIAENVSRKDLTPIEEARAMKRYRDEFKKTSAEVGKLFGLSESAIRNKIRLLDLPEDAQQHLAAGEITEGTARNLLTVGRIASAEKVSELATRIATGSSYNPESEMETAISQASGAHEMWPRYRGGDPRGGVDLWPLDWDAGEILPYPTFQQWKKYFTRPVDLREFRDLKEMFEDITRSMAGDFLSPGYKLHWEEVIHSIEHLLHPPACTACPFYARLGGDHYCGAKLCWDRKRDKWAGQELERKSQEMGIQVYQEWKDGAVFEECPDYEWNGSVAVQHIKEMVQNKDPFLRLRLKIQNGRSHMFTNSYLTQVISIDEESRNRVMKVGEAEQQETQERSRLQKLGELRNRKVEAAGKFVETVAAPVFGYAFHKLAGGLLESLLKYSDCHHYGNHIDLPDGLNDKERIGWILSARLMREHYFLAGNILGEGPAAVAKHLKGVAATWGVTLPCNWMEVAESMEVEE
jgi:ParB/RepB/Spo0J family partition protein